MPQRISGNIKAPLQWAISQTSGSTASVSKPASAGIVHVCTAILLTCAYATGSSTSFWELLDGATPLVSGYITTTTQQGMVIALSDLNIPGTAGNAMTLSITGWTGAVPFNSVSLVGYEL